ncbi:hypothetical protein EDB84DRAFT_1554913 [Lactarius hengduanensis]|nr:hypothetical protein EDB84DRAFT_1554913 [Lactarius hengduanensis]
MLLREREPPARERAAEDGSPGFQRESTPASAKPDLVPAHRDDYEPSPTPAPRPRQSLDESVRKFPQLAIPAPLPALPSESRSVAEQQAQADKSTSTARRKTSAASTVTMRGNVGNPGLTITTPSAAPTTAVTTMPASRTDSGQSSASASSSGASSSRHAQSNDRDVLAPADSEHRRAERAAAPARHAVHAWPREAHVGPKSHLSLDAPPQPAGAQATTGAAATARGGGGVQTLARATSTRERRRTITEIFS